MSGYRVLSLFGIGRMCRSRYLFVELYCEIQLVEALASVDVSAHCARMGVEDARWDAARVLLVVWC
jgi:hypothetical protein